MKLFETPRNRSTVQLYGFMLVAVQPLFSYFHYTWNEAVKPYPANADSLSIPIFMEIILWVFLAPLAVLTISLLTRQYQGGISLFTRLTTAKKVSVKTVLLNIFFGLLIIYALIQMFDVFTYYNIPILVDALLSIYLLLVLRATSTASTR